MPLNPPELQALVDDVTAQNSVIASLNTFFAGLPALIAAAVAAAGMTPAQVQQVKDAADQVVANNAAITAGILANTPVTQAQAKATK